jgi:cytochrome d ubiquinol oxidase subunit II
VWLIFVIVLLFTCFPYGYSALSIGLFTPLHLALLGIILRGASFVFHGYGRSKAGMPGEHLHAVAWEMAFGVASLMSPLLLGAAFGSITSGSIRVEWNQVVFAHPHPWLTPYAICCGVLALCVSAYLAAVYLCVETKEELREDFRRRAIFGGTATTVVAGVTLVAAWFEAHWFFERLMSGANVPVTGAGLIAFGLSAWAVFTRRFLWARFFAATEITLLLASWALAHQPYFLYPDVTLEAAAGPITTIQFLVIATLLGMVVLVPSLVYLMRVFKSSAGLSK